MGKKTTFFLGILTGVILTFVVSWIIATAKQGSKTDSIQYLEQPVSYEDKTETTFEVFQVFEDSALATEASGKIGKDVTYFGNTVLLLGNDFYNDQIVTVKNPQRIGSYSYNNNVGTTMKVPVISGTMK